MAIARWRGGWAMVDALLSSLLLAVCISGLASVWVFCLNQVQRSRELTIAGQIARSVVEFGKLHGYPYLPKGSYTLQSNAATWTGSYDRLGNSGKGRWLQGSKTYYNTLGLECSAVDTEVRYATELVLIDSDVAPSRDGANYDLGTRARRTLTVTVLRLPESKPMLRMSTEIVRDGL
jgi:hypothetical protein